MIQIKEDIIKKGRRFLEIWNENYEVKDYEFEANNGAEFVDFVYSNWKKFFSKDTPAHLMHRFADDVTTAQYGKTDMFDTNEFDDLVLQYEDSFYQNEKYSDKYALKALEFDYMRLLASLCMIASVCLENYMGDDSNENTK